MKKILAALLAVIAICSVSRADEFVIYRGTQADRQNDSSLKRYGYYYIFDVSTSSTAANPLQFTSVQFGPVGGLATSSNKYYSTSGTYSYLAFPATQKGAKTQTDFIYTITTTSTSTPFNTVAFGDFKGHNTGIGNLGGGFSGSFPDAVTLIARDASGDSNIPTDNVELISGVFELSINLTRDSNNANNPPTTNETLSGAVEFVTQELLKGGYRPTQ